MRFLLDTNVLLALMWESHQHHGTASNWLEGVDAFATCPLTQAGFLRISANPSFPFAVSMNDAFAALEALCSDARHEFWMDDISFLSPVLDRASLRFHGQVTDSYLVTLARQRVGALATFDTNLANEFSAVNAVRLLA